MHLAAYRELLRRYWQVFIAAWGIRNETNPPGRVADERAFLPAVLELQESPPHPAARATLWLIISLLLITLLWAVLGEIDIVAVARGKLVVSARSKVIQPLQPSIVRAIHVSDGQFVTTGQLLIELDPTISDAESGKASTAWIEALLEARRSEALIAALANRRLPEMGQISELRDQPLRIAEANRLMQSQWLELQTRLATIDADTTSKSAERETYREQVQKLEQTLPLIRQRALDYRDLADKGFVPKHAYLDREQARIEAEGNLRSQRRQVEELTGKLDSNLRQKEATMAEFRRSQENALAQANERVRQAKLEVVKAKQFQKQTQLTAPISGVVQQLAVHTEGGVVTEAQPLLVIVPKEETIEAEVFVENKDIGFVRAGQPASAKIDSFSFTKYGLIECEVSSISLDAIQDEKRGLIYQTRIRLAKSSMQIAGKTVPLVPGMAVTVDIKTGKRRIIEYFLSPLIQYGSESLRER